MPINMDKRADNSTTNFAPNFSAIFPAKKAPTGIPPKNAREKILITLPLNLSLVNDCTKLFKELRVSISPSPIPAV